MSPSKDKIHPTDTSKEWAKLFLWNWNLAVELWSDGDLFKPHLVGQVQQGRSNFTASQLRDQREYAFICSSYLIPNHCAEPHVVAEGG